ncbi:MAG: hypothetical protein IH934_03165 [Nanoarchaeota archaeon]|nr:hypothetical protein [Nanoarchaeota archaeon]
MVQRAHDPELKRRLRWLEHTIRELNSEFRSILQAVSHDTEEAERTRKYLEEQVQGIRDAFQQIDEALLRVEEVDEEYWKKTKLTMERLRDDFIIIVKRWQSGANRKRVIGYYDEIYERVIEIIDSQSDEEIVKFIDEVRILSSHTSLGIRYARLYYDLERGYNSGRMGKREIVERSIKALENLYDIYSYSKGRVRRGNI